MMVKLSPVLVFALAIFLTSGSPAGTPTHEIFKGYTECVRNSDCPENYCCTIGMQRYSVPTCNRLGVKDDPCRASQPAPSNFSLSYPNLRTVEVQSAYLLMCPCDPMFACDRDSNSCQDPATAKTYQKPLDKSQVANDI